MKSSIAILISILATPGILSASDDLSVDTAIGILETSLNRRERITALAALRDAEERAAPATAVLGRIVATAPSGDEAGYASEALGHVGKQSIPIIAALVPNGFDYSYLFAKRTIPRFPREVEADLLAALEPVFSLHPAPERFNAILALRWFSLSPEAANRLTQAQLEDRSYTSKLGGALFLSQNGNDPSILATIDAHPFLCMKYLGARLREEWRRRDSPIHKHRRMMHVPQPLPADEQSRCKAADAELAKLAADAIPEALEQLKRAHDTHEKYLWMETLKALSFHATLPPSETVETLESAWRERGSLIDLLLAEFRSKLTTNSKQGGADQPATAPESKPEDIQKPKPESEPALR